MKNRTAPSAVLKEAFTYWQKATVPQIVYSTLYLILVFGGYFYFLNYFGLWEDLRDASQLLQSDPDGFNAALKEVARRPEAGAFSLAIFAWLSFVNVLNAGLYHIYSRIDAGEKPQVNDLFAGYRGLSFFKFFGFYLFWIIIFSYANVTLVLGLAWILLTLLCVPLMYFKNLNSFAGISKTFSFLKKNFIAAVICVFVAVLFSLCGLLLCGVGFIFTLPFWHSMIYTLYRSSKVE